MISRVRGFLDWWVGRWTAPSEDIDGQPPAWDPLWVRVASGIAFQLAVGLGVPTVGIIALRGTTGMVPDEFMPFVTPPLMVTLLSAHWPQDWGPCGTSRTAWSKRRSGLPFTSPYS